MADAKETTTVYKVGEQSEADPYEFVMSSDTVDRMGDIVEQDWKLSHFKKNPIALWGHSSMQPIGVWKQVRVVGNQLLGKLHLAEKGTSEFIDFLRSMIEQRILKAVSVGFYPHKHEVLDEDEPWGGWRLMDNELLECSLVSVPANPEALSLAKSLSTRTRERFFAESGKPKTLAGAAEQMGFEKPESQDSDDIPPVVAPSKTDSQRRTHTMSLSDKISAKKDSITALKDQIAAATDEIGEDGGVGEELQLQIEELSAAVYDAEKELVSLERAEAALVVRAAVTADDARDTAAQRSTGSAAASKVNRAPVKRIEAKKVRAKGHNQMAVFACMLAGHAQRRNPGDVARDAYPDEPELEMITRTAVDPASTTVDEWAGNLVRDSYGEFLELLYDMSVYPALPGTRATFDRSGRIIIPRQEGRGELAGGFVGQLVPIPVKKGFIGVTDLTPKKMAVISPYSKELGRQSTPQIQSVIGNQILNDTAAAIDGHYLGDSARTATHPGGRQDAVETGAANIESATGVTVATINADTKAMIGRFLSSRSGKMAVWIMNPLRVLGLQTIQDSASGAFPFADQIAAGTFQGYPLLTSQNVPEDVVFLQSNGAMTYGDAFAPMIEADDTATLILDDAPEADIGAAIAGTQTVQSLYQIDGIALKLTLGIDWRQTRANAVQVLDTVAW